jgi:hypothetical protein
MVLTCWIEQKLSATASAFQPYGLRVAPMNTAPIPGTTQHLNAIIAAEASPSKPAEITHFGIFTTDTDAIHTSLDVSHLYTDSCNPTDRPI